MPWLSLPVSEVWLPEWTRPSTTASATVTVTGTSNGLAVADSFDVIVSAVNDAPVFAGGSTFTTAENNASASFLVGATDADGDALTYSKTGADADKFNLNTATGELNWKIPPDYEANASAAGNNAYAVTVTVTVTVDLIVAKFLSVGLSSCPSSVFESKKSF